jgi:hypothetical protein
LFRSSIEVIHLKLSSRELAMIIDKVGNSVSAV